MTHRTAVQRKKSDAAIHGPSVAQALQNQPATTPDAARIADQTPATLDREHPGAESQLATETQGPVDAGLAHQFARLPVMAPRAGRPDDALTPDHRPPGAEALPLHAGGDPLPQPLREKFEHSLGADLAEVRVHTGQDSIAAARAVNARAFVVDQDIHFGRGVFSPTTTQGERLLAHEVAHTVQQSRAPESATGVGLTLSKRGDASELEADRAADAMLAGMPAPVSAATHSSGTLLQRDENGAEGAGGTSGGGGEGGADAGVATLPSSTDYDPMMDPAAKTKPPVEPYDWFSAAAPVSEEIIGSWGGEPQYNMNYAHPAMVAGMQAFTTTWRDANSSWAAAAPLVIDYNYAAGAAGGDADAAAEEAVSDVSQAKVGESFAGDDLAFSSGIIDMKKLSKEKRLELKKGKDELQKKNNAVEIKWRNVTKGLNTAQKSMNDGAKALAGMKIKTVQMGIEIDESRKSHIEMEKAAAVGAIQGATKLTSGVIKAFVKPDDAIGDLVEGTGKLVETGASLAYDVEIQSISSSISLAKVKIASIEADIEELNFKNAMLDAENAMTDVRTAHDEYKEAVMERKTALAEFSRTLEEMAIASGASKKDAAKLQNAVEAVPRIEQAIALAGKVRDAIRIPPYTESSGLGAAVAENRSDFVAHVAVMKGYRENLNLHQQKWARRLNAVNKFM